jgi:hypothetical protein
MKRPSGLNRMLLTTTFVTFTLGLASTVGVPGAFAGADYEFQAPRAADPGPSSLESDPLQAPRGQDMQLPRA